MADQLPDRPAKRLVRERLASVSSAIRSTPTLTVPTGVWPSRSTTIRSSSPCRATKVTYDAKQQPKTSAGVRFGCMHGSSGVSTRPPCQKKPAARTLGLRLEEGHADGSPRVHGKGLNGPEEPPLTSRAQGETNGQGQHLKGRTGCKQNGSH